MHGVCTPFESCPPCTPLPSRVYHISQSINITVHIFITFLFEYFNMQTQQHGSRLWCGCTISGLHVNTNSKMSASAPWSIPPRSILQPNLTLRASSGCNNIFEHLTENKHNLSPQAEPSLQISVEEHRCPSDCVPTQLLSCTKSWENFGMEKGLYHEYLWDLGAWKFCPMFAQRIERRSL